MGSGVRAPRFLDLYYMELEGVSGSCPSALHPGKYFAVPIGPGVGWAPELLPSRWRAEKFRSPISGSFMLFGSEVNYCACAVESKIQNACFVTSARYSAARVGGRLSEWTALAGSADR